MAPTLVVYQPPANLMVQIGQPFLVTGQASDRGMPEPIAVSSVTVQVDGGPPVPATRTHVPDKTRMVITYKASVEVTGGQDPHSVAVTATNDQGISTTKTVTVFTGPVFEVDAPAVLIDISPFASDPTDPKIVGWLSMIQQQLASMSALLVSSGQLLAGPNVLLTTNPEGVSVLRIGLWFEDQTFPVVTAIPPDFPLPRLTDAAATAGFDTVPLLAVPQPRGGPAFAISVSTAGLQRLLNAVAPAAEAAATQGGATLKSLTVTTTPPGSVVTSFSGDLPIVLPFSSPASFSIMVVEALGTRQLSESLQIVPAIIGSSHSSSVGDWLYWVAGYLNPLIFLAMYGASVIVSDASDQIAGQITGVATPLVASLPSRVPFRNTDLPGSPLPYDFPTLLPSWTAFGATPAAVVGAGTISIAPREQATVALILNGSDHIRGYQEDLAGGAGQAYTFTLVDLAPDQGAVTWQVSGTMSRHGSINLDPFSQGGMIQVVFPLPLHVEPGTYPFTLTMSAVETCGSDPTKTLTAASTISVQVDVLPNPKVPP